GINLSFELVPMFYGSLRGTNLDFPSGIEKIRTGQDNISMVQDQYRCHSHETQKSIADKRRQFTKSRRQADVGLSPADCMIPNLQSTLSLDLANNSVRRANAMM